MTNENNMNMQTQRIADSSVSTMSVHTLVTALLDIGWRIDARAAICAYPWQFGSQGGPMIRGDQFAPYEPSYMKRWREGLEGKNTPRPTKELDKVVAQIKKGHPLKKKG